MATSLTIYNRGTALVRQERTFSLHAGENTVDFTDVAATIDRTSVTVKAMPDANAVRVLEQSFLYDLVGLGGLLRRYTDATIAVTMEDGTTFSGTLLSGQSDMHNPQPDIILRGTDNQVTVVRHNVRDIRFPQLPDGLRTRPTLRWTLASTTDGEQTLILTYLADGMHWTADYNLLLNATSTAFDLIGWVTLTNESGTAFHDAQVKLIAGEVNRIEPERPEGMMMKRAMAFAAAPAADIVEQREMFEYQLYEIARRVSVENNETKQVEFLARSGVPASLVYQVALHSHYGGYGHQPMTGRTDAGGANTAPVDVFAAFTTAKDGGVDADMPAGRLRVFQNDSDGAAILIGEACIDHTPKGEPVRVALGSAFDLRCDWTQQSFTLLSKTEMTETFVVRLRNRKEAQAVEIQVYDRLFRWSNWTIEDATHPHEVVDAGRVRFTVTVPPQGETVLAYTVRYSWPPDRAQ